MQSQPRRVAVLDDDIRFIRLVERILASDEIEVEPVTTLDIEEARRVIALSNCQAALVDIYMYGDVYGFRLVERLRKDPELAALPIIVASGAKREIGRRVGFLQENGCRVLIKPFHPEELLAAVESATFSSPTDGGITPRAPLPLAQRLRAQEG
jgi:DNA-binding response OmpR family regulator